MENSLNIIFVCTGNTCRSPMAQAILNDEAEKLGLPIYASSAGLAAFEGAAASENAVRVMAELGLDLRSHRSRQISGELLKDCDLVVCMNDDQRRALRFTNKRLLAFPGGIPDPYGLDIRAYRRCRDILSIQIEELIDLIAPIEIKLMTERDVPAVSEIEKECFSVPWSEKALYDALDARTAQFFTARRLGKIIGYIGTNTAADECYISNLAVTAAHRRKGAGTKLLETAKNAARNKGASFISLEVRKSEQEAVSLYKKRGFIVCGERKRFYSEPDEDALIMTNHLK